MGKIGFCFELSLLFGLKLHLRRRALALGTRRFLPQQEFLSYNFLQPGRVRNFWWGAWNGLGDGRQEILFLPPVLCRPRRMFRMGSKDTLLEPCVIWVPAGCLEGHQEQGEGCKMLRIQEHGQRLQRVGTSGWVRNRKTGDAGL